MKDLGAKGEQLATEYLLSQGFSILQRNFLSPLKSGEIDIIASEKGDLVFVEVKYYQRNSLKDIHEAVNKVKQSRIIKTAREYLFANNLENSYTRFDILLISYDDNSEVSDIELHRDAFRP